MPRTASSQIQSRSNVKARPSANVRAGNLVANTPVLFRLPAIPTAPAQDLAMTFSEAAISLPTATLAAVALSSAQPVATSAEQVSEVSVTPQAAPQQTWWEHWSSGIVLIVLLIALATASILAWQGSNKGNSKLMADTKKEADSENDLSHIEVPRLELPKMEMPVSTKSNSYVDKLETANAQNNATQSNSLKQKSDEGDSSLIPNGSLSLTLDPPEDSQARIEPETYATASLQSPVVKQQEPLFKDSDLTQAKSNISAQPASTTSQRSSTPSDQPSLWDSSKTNTPDINKPLTLELSSQDSSLGSNSNEPSSSASAKLISPANTDTSNQVSASTAPTLVPKDLQNAVKTVNPEMDQAELIAAYRKMNAATAPTKVQNLYRVAASTPTQAVSTPGTPAATVGYSQPAMQPNQQPNQQPALGSNNYTLQPAQNNTSNSSMQPQYSAPQNPSPQLSSQQLPSQQYQNQQSPNPPYPQYPTQQYSSQQNYGQQNYAQQYSGQQYSGQQSQVPTQYSTQSQPGMPNVNGMQMQPASNQSATGASGMQYGGAQVPYVQPAQASALQLPPGPIGGYGLTPSTAGGTSNPGAPNSPSYPSLQ